MNIRTRLLFRSTIQATVHRLRYDFIQEFVVFLCSAIIFSTFLYIFDDFLNEDIAQVSKLLRNQLAGPCLIVAWCLATTLTYRLLKAEITDDTSWSSWAARQGECPANVRSLLFWRSVMISVAIHSVFWLATYHLLLPLTVAQIVVGEGVLICVVWALLTMRGSVTAQTQTQPQHRSLVFKDITTSNPRQRHRALFRWRWMQIKYRKRSHQLILGFSMTFAATAGFVAAKQLPLFAAWILCFSAGNLASWVIAFQAADDLDFAWSERCLGVSHDDYIGIYRTIARSLTILLAAGAIITGAITSAYYGNVGETALSTSWLTLVFTLSVCPLLMPDLLLQVDGHRPVIQITMVTLFGLFIATAVFAHPLGILLVPLLKYYAAEVQKNRYYRA